LFLASRKKNRAAERVKLNCQVTLISRRHEFSAISEDVSEGGFSFDSGFPWYFEPGEHLDITLSDGAFSCRMVGSIAHVSSIPDGWRYAVTFSGMTEASKSQLYLLLYDREPPLDPQLQGTASVFSVIAENLGRDRRATLTHERLLPRIAINLSFTDEEWGRVLIEDFNYQSVRLRFVDIRETPEQVTLPLPEGRTLHCELSRNLLDARRGVVNQGLYSIEDYQDLIADPACYQLIEQWMLSAREHAAAQQAIESMRTHFFSEQDWV
jgi:cellulose synthase (UDP-forming)